MEWFPPVENDLLSVEKSGKFGESLGNTWGKLYPKIRIAKAGESQNLLIFPHQRILSEIYNYSLGSKNRPVSLDTYSFVILNIGLLIEESGPANALTRTEVDSNW
jgi:hypothetical protein